MRKWGSSDPLSYIHGVRLKRKKKQMNMIQAVKNAQEQLTQRLEAGNPQEAHIQFERPRGGGLDGEKFTLILNTRKYGNCILSDWNQYVANVELMRNGKGMVATTYFFGTKITKTLYFEDLKCVKVTYVDEWVPENMKEKETEVETENLPF